MKEKDDFATIVEAMEEWVKHHSDPDKPLIEIQSEGRAMSLSPKQLLEEIRIGSPIGQFHKKALIKVAADFISGKYRPKT